MTIDDVFRNLENTVKAFQGIIVDRNFGKTNNIISWPEYIPGISDLIYTREFEFLISKRQFSLLLTNDSLLQIVYRFEDEELTMIRLAYYPKPEMKKLEFDDVDQMYDEGLNDFFKEQYLLMFDAISQDFSLTNTSHLRFDFNLTHVSHCQNHVQFGSVNDIRIPVDHFILPFTFVDFIAKNIFQSYRNELTGDPAYMYCKSEADKLYRKYSVESEDNVFLSRNLST